MENQEVAKKLFKAIYGELISLEYEKLSNEEVVKIALATITQFAERQGIKTKTINY